MAPKRGDIDPEEMISLLTPDRIGFNQAFTAFRLLIPWLTLPHGLVDEIETMRWASLPESSRFWAYETGIFIQMVLLRVCKYPLTYDDERWIHIASLMGISDAYWKWWSETEPDPDRKSFCARFTRPRGKDTEILLSGDIRLGRDFTLRAGQFVSTRRNEILYIVDQKVPPAHCGGQ